MRIISILILLIVLVVSCKDDNLHDCYSVYMVPIDSIFVKNDPIKCVLFMDNCAKFCNCNVPVFLSIDKGSGVVKCNDMIYNQGYLFDYNQQLLDTLEFYYVPYSIGFQELTFSFKTMDGSINKKIYFDVKKTLLNVEIPDLPEYFKYREMKNVTLRLSTNLKEVKLGIRFVKGFGSVDINGERVIDYVSISQFDNLLTITPESLGEIRIDFLVYNEFSISTHYIIEFLSIY